MASVEIRNAKKAYGSVQVIHDASIHIADGEFVILVGPSGCGKSTLLRMVAGLETITDGEIRIDGDVVNRLEPKDRNIAMVFQSYALYPQMTVAQNMGFALELAGVPKEERQRQVLAAAGILGLEPLLERYPRQLSGGQRQRVAMGRAIVRNPKVFLFDEPLSNLDAKLRVSMRGEIKALQKRLSTTTIYVTHDQIEAMTMADKIVVMQAGKVEQIGSPLAVYDRPVNMFVAGFLGSPAMNFISGTLVTGEAPSLKLDSGAAIPLPAIPAALNGRKVILGIRPEHLNIHATSGIAAHVVTVEPTGYETLIEAEIDKNNKITCLLQERSLIQPGDTIRLSFAGGPLHFFDPETTARLDL
jgi:multiple sugar transport system ATP-binding protein